MRKLIVSMNMTLDGFMAGPDHELDWHFQSWTGEMAESLCEQLSQADTILLGRITYKAMAKYWPAQITDPSFPRGDIDVAEMMNSYSKIVFSKTLANTDWNNSRIVKKNMAGEIAQLKQQPGKDIIIYGSGKLVSALLQLGLIDECRIWMHPVLLGEGKRLFKDLHVWHYMKLHRTKAFDSGVVILYYNLGQ